ncbi:MAG: hypothetical protein ACRD2Z_08125 [Thermoanaerobaculia bacterium]
MRTTVAVGLRLLALAGLLVVPGTAFADDRDLLRASSGRPMLFVLLDTSESMYRSPACSQGDFDAGRCDPLCAEGDCFVPRQADDPRSKFFQARAALYEVIRQVDDLRLGWATGNQDRLAVRSKHWLYRATTAGPVIPGFGPYPVAGQEEVFGRLWECETGADDGLVGCGVATPADLDDPWERMRIQRLPKGGLDTQEPQSVFLRAAGATHRLVYEPVTPFAPGAGSISVAVSHYSCGAGACTDLQSVDVVQFALVGDFLSWDGGASRTEPGMGFFSADQAADATAENACAGWEPNTDGRADAVDGVDLKFPTVQDPDASLRPQLDRGDVIPWDWRTDNRDAILDRLAPNRLLDEGEPDFGVARYLHDTAEPGAAGLDFRDPAVRVPIPAGSSSLAAMIEDFRSWYAEWEPLARDRDPEFGCQPRYLLLVTGGDTSCGNGRDVCALVDSLRLRYGIRTFVVGFGRPGADDRLQCIATSGGTERPLFPASGDELFDALLSVVGEIREETAAFAPAAATGNRTTAGQTTFLSSFTPVNGSGTWPGRVDAFLGPLPLTEGDRPDTSRACGADTAGACHLWNAGEVLLDQVNPADFLGSGVGQRRVFYSRLSRSGEWPTRRRVFSTPPSANGATETSIRYDIWRGLGLVGDATPDGAVAGAGGEEAVAERFEEIAQGTLEVKSAAIESEGSRGERTSATIDYVLGGSFHATPLLIGAPPNTALFARDAGFGQDATCDSGANRGYRCFAARHEKRRRQLVLGSDDGMVHVFDAGVYRASGVDPATRGSLEEEFDNGRGRELWAYVPRPALPVVTGLAEGNRHLYGVDGTPAAADAFLDPLFDPAAGPAPGEREWRTVLIGGFREAGADLEARGLTGGRGYYALDITQPDRLEAELVPRPGAGGWMPSCLGSPVEDNRRPTPSRPADGCGPVPYPAPLWEFTDSALAPIPDAGGAAAGMRWVPLDEDGNGSGDLGDTWSTPGIGRILVCDGSGGSCDPRHPDNGNPYDPDSPGGLTVKTVAVFGGGMDVASKADPLAAAKGNWIYMVDVETGEAIYKRLVLGAVPAPPAAVDLDSDGYLDRIYVGTTAGLLYRVDLIATGGAAGGSALPRLETVSVTDVEGNTHQVARVTHPAWRPHILFDAEGRPIYLRPSVIAVATLGGHAVAFGTGDRDDLRRRDGTEGRFYIFVDDVDIDPGSDAEPAPITESQLTHIDPADGETGRDLLLDPGSQLRRGWFLALGPDERLVNDPFAISGVTTFSTFVPSAGTGAQACEPGGENRIYALNTATSSGVLEGFGGASSRSIAVDSLVSSAYAEPSPTVAAPGDDEGDTGPVAPPDAGQLDDRQQRILETLKSLFPASCTFANYRIDVKAIAADTRLEHIAPVPVCITQKNWKEF